MSEHEQVTDYALLTDPVTDDEITQLRVMLADASLYNTAEDASWRNVLRRLLARIDADAKVIAEYERVSQIVEASRVCPQCREVGEHWQGPGMCERHAAEIAAWRDSRRQG